MRQGKVRPSGVARTFGANEIIVTKTDLKGRSGYHSNRRVPTSGALRRIEPLYASLVAEERRHSRPADALEASTVMLTDILAKRGMSYDQYLWSTVGDGTPGTRTSA